MESINTTSLELLVSSSTVREVIVMPYRKGYQIRVRWGGVEKPLRSQRESVRVFKSINSACKLLKDLGVQQATVVL